MMKQKLLELILLYVYPNAEWDHSIDGEIVIYTGCFSKQEEQA